MVEFNQTPGPNQAPNYLNESRNVDKAQPNRAFEALFEGVGNTLKVSAAATEDADQQAIDNQIYKSHDQVSSEYNLANMEASNSGDPNFYTTSNGPPEVDTVVGKLEKLTMARSAGKISDTYYWSQMESNVKSLRARYPNQRDYIDSKVSKITGGTPANQLRDSLQRDLAKQQELARSQQTKQDTFVMNNLGFIPEGQLRAYQEGNPEAFQEIQYTVASRKRDEEDIKATKAQLELASSQGKLNVETAQQGAANHVNMVTSRFITDKASRAGVGSFTDLQRRIQSFTGTGKAPSPEEQTQLLAQFSQLKYELSTQIRGALTTPDENGKSWSTYLDPTRVKQLEEQGMAQLQQLEDLITNQQYGLLNIAINQQKAQSDARVKKFIDTYPVAQTIDTLKRVGGEQLVATAMSLDGGKMLNDSVIALINAQTLNSAANGTGSLNQYAQELKETTNKDPVAFTKIINDHVNSLLAKDTNPQVALNIAQSMFGSDNTPFIQNFRTNQDKMSVYSKMASPQVTAKMQELSKDDPLVWQNYSNWSKNAFLAVFGGYIDQTQEGVLSRPYTDVTFDPATAQFSWKMTEQGRESQRSVTGFLSGANVADNWRNSALDSAVKELNRGISLIKPVLEAEGADTTQEIINLIKSKGLDTSSAKPDSFWSKLYRSVLSAEGAVRQNLSDVVGGSAPTGGSPFEAFFGEWTATPQGVNPNRERAVLDFIGQPESGGNYNAISGNAKNQEPLDTLTVSQVLDLQKHMIGQKDKFPSSAIGKYQFINSTLSGLVKELEIDTGALFTPELQDQLAYTLLERRGLSDYRSGKLTKEQFSKNLAMEWASLPLPSGQSYYDGDGLNKALVSYEDLASVLD